MPRASRNFWPHPSGVMRRSGNGRAVDSDAAGENIKKRLIGQARNCKKLLDEMFVLQIGGLIQGTEQHKILTIEDLIPIGLYRRAVEQFVQKWHPDVPSENRKPLRLDPQ